MQKNPKAIETTFSHKISDITFLCRMVLIECLSKSRSASQIRERERESEMAIVFTQVHDEHPNPAINKLVM